MNQSRQNSLLVVTTQHVQDRKYVDTELRCFHKGKRLSTALGLLLTEYLLIDNEPNDEKKTAINLLYSKYLNFIQLNMIQLTETQKIALTVLLREINSGHKGLTNKVFLDSLKGTVTFSNLFEFYGNLRNKEQQFLIKETRRPSKHHRERYIGVGYKDKGTAKLESWDGFHSWQEITATGEAKLKEKIRANSFKLKGKIPKSLRQFQSIEIKKDPFGNSIKLHLELVKYGNLLGYREYHPDENLRQEILETMARTKKYSNRFIPARDYDGRYIYLTDIIQ